MLGLPCELNSIGSLRLWRGACHVWFIVYATERQRSVISVSNSPNVRASRVETASPELIQEFDSVGVAYDAHDGVYPFIPIRTVVGTVQITEFDFRKLTQYFNGSGSHRLISKLRFARVHKETYD